MFFVREDFGNPRFHAVWANEADNRTMKATLRNVASRTFENVGLGKLQALLNRSEVKRRRIA